MKNYLMDESIFLYPESFKKMIELNLVDFDIWYVLDSEWALSLYKVIHSDINNMVSAT